MTETPRASLQRPRSRWVGIQSEQLNLALPTTSRDLAGCLDLAPFPAIACFYHQGAASVHNVSAIQSFMASRTNRCTSQRGAHDGRGNNAFKPEHWPRVLSVPALATVGGRSFSVGPLEPSSNATVSSPLRSSSADAPETDLGAEIDAMLADRLDPFLGQTSAGLMEAFRNADPESDAGESGAREAGKCLRMDSLEMLSSISLNGRLVPFSLTAPLRGKDAKVSDTLLGDFFAQPLSAAPSGLEGLEEDVLVLSKLAWSKKATLQRVMEETWLAAANLILALWARLADDLCEGEDRSRALFFAREDCEFVLGPKVAYEVQGRPDMSLLYRPSQGQPWQTLAVVEVKPYVSREFLESVFLDPAGPMSGHAPIRKRKNDVRQGSSSSSDMDDSRESAGGSSNPSTNAFDLFAQVLKEIVASGAVIGIVQTAMETVVIDRRPRPGADASGAQQEPPKAAAFDLHVHEAAFAHPFDAHLSPPSSEEASSLPAGQEPSSKHFTWVKDRNLVMLYVGLALRAHGLVKRTGYNFRPDRPFRMLASQTQVSLPGIMEMDEEFPAPATSTDGPQEVPSSTPPSPAPSDSRSASRPRPPPPSASSTTSNLAGPSRQVTSGWAGVLSAPFFAKGHDALAYFGCLASTTDGTILTSCAELWARSHSRPAVNCGHHQVVFKEARAKRPGSAARLARECIAFGQLEPLQHQGVLPRCYGVFELNQDSEALAFAYEDVGPTLRDEDVVERIKAEGLAGSLEAILTSHLQRLHQAGFSHGDVVPSNVAIRFISAPPSPPGSLCSTCRRRRSQGPATSPTRAPPHKTASWKLSSVASADGESRAGTSSSSSGPSSDGPLPQTATEGDPVCSVCERTSGEHLKLEVRLLDLALSKRLADADVDAEEEVKADMTQLEASLRSLRLDVPKRRG